MSKRANQLNGKNWVQYSISVWDMIKTSEENKLGHPAMFPIELCNRLIECYSLSGDTVLDPFSGSGSTLVAAKGLARNSYGFEINEKYVKLIKSRVNKIKWGKLLDERAKIKNTKLSHFVNQNECNNDEIVDISIPPEGTTSVLMESCYNIPNLLPQESVDLIVTSPPYWDILRQKRTADYKDSRPYSDDTNDIGNIESYEEFISELGKIFDGIKNVLKKKKICAIVVMDLRKKDKFYPLHSDLATEMVKHEYKFEDIIIWNRAKEYNNIRALGYPYVFRVNKVHEYILIFSKI